MQSKTQFRIRTIAGVCLFYAVVVTGCAGPLHNAIHQGDQARAIQLIKHGKNVKVRDHKSVTPLQLAAFKGQLDVVKALVAREADVNRTTANFGSSLTQAAMGGHPEVVEWLLGQGANIDVRTRNGSSPLYDAALRNHPDVVRMLLAHGADVNARTKDGFTPLHIAAEMRHRRVVKKLLAHGADVHAKTVRGITPLNSAMYNVYVPHDITEMLIVAGAKVNVVKGLPGMTGGTYRAMASHVEARGDTARAISLYETAADYFDAAVVAVTAQKRAKRNALAKSLAMGLLDTIEQQTLLPAMQGSHPHATIHSQVVATKLASGQAFRANSTPPIAHSDASRVRGKAYDIQQHAEACRRQAALLRKQ